MDQIFSVEVSTLLPELPDNGRYDVTFIRGPEDLPKKGIVGPDVHSTCEKRFLRSLNALSYVDVTVFELAENFTSNHCPACDQPKIFHPESIE
ncbi:uncharacterized protein JCM6883_006402, partial [Sporobolomyces salmoneus]|uniref:uncharacterized protein n=1 Tax=Sporobolomyces salmoneus TaxID=183962 RepID=UPI003181DC7D